MAVNKYSKYVRIHYWLYTYVLSGFSLWFSLSLQVASARFACFSYCGRGFARSARFTSYDNPICTIEVVKLNTYLHGVETEGYRSDRC